MVLYSRADSWLGWGESRESDNVLRSLRRIFQISMHGLVTTFQSLFIAQEEEGQEAGKPLSAPPAPRSSWPLACMLGQLRAARCSAQAAINAGWAAGRAQPRSSRVLPPPPPGQFRDTVQPRRCRLAADRTARHRQQPQHLFHAAADPRAALGEDPRLLRVFAQPAAAAQPHQADDERHAVRHRPAHARTGRAAPSSQIAEAEFTIPPELLVHNNALTIQFIGHYVMVCEDPANTTLWARVHRNTYLDIQGDLLPLADDLKQLPLPFLDPAVIQPLSLPVVFASAPSFKAIQAAGIVTSYFGMISENRPVRFPVHIGAIPAGQRDRHLRQCLQTCPRAWTCPASTRPPWPCAPIPTIRTARCWSLPGSDADQVVRAAQAVALHSDLLQGAQTTIDDAQPARQAGGRCRAALGAHRPDRRAVGLRHRRPVAGRRLGAAERLLPHSRRTSSTPSGPTPSCGSPIATTRFPSVPSPACRCASTTPFSARCR